MEFDPDEYFSHPKMPKHKLYEALRAYFLESETINKIAQQYGYTYFSLQTYIRDFRRGKIDFFPAIPKGPKERSVPATIQEKIIYLRKQNKSVYDIEAYLKEENTPVSVSTIDRILRDEGFAPLPKRTYKQIGRTKVGTIIPEKSSQLDFENLTRATYECEVAGIYLFVPFMIELDLYNLIRRSSYPSTQQLSNVNYISSVLSLKLMGLERLLHISNFNFDYGLGFFAGLNVLPKPVAISTYSYGIDKDTNYNFMKTLIKKINSLDKKFYNAKTINLDFHTIPHYGEEPPLDKNWISARGKAMKSALTFFAQDGDSQMINYANADIRRKDAPNEILNFVKYWFDIKGVVKETLVFDSKLTNYTILKQLDGMNVKFLTLRRRGDALVEKYISKPRCDWTKIELDIPKRKYNKFLVLDEEIPLYRQKMKIRQIVIRDHGREKPTFTVTNNRDFSVEDCVTLYARRWRIENKLSELVDFFSLNALSSPIMIRIHFDVLMSVVADSLYKLFSRKFPAFENRRAPEIFRKFVNRGGKIVVDRNNVCVKMRKNAHTPLLRSCEIFRKPVKVPWWGNKNLTYEWK